jgi:hypothetical protein
LSSHSTDPGDLPRSAATAFTEAPFLKAEMAVACSAGEQVWSGNGAATASKVVSMGVSKTMSSWFSGAPASRGVGADS